jgi:hypothetical protein
MKKKIAAVEEWEQNNDSEITKKAAQLNTHLKRMKKKILEGDKQIASSIKRYKTTIKKTMEDIAQNIERNCVIYRRNTMDELPYPTWEKWIHAKETLFPSVTLPTGSSSTLSPHNVDDESIGEETGEPAGGGSGGENNEDKGS